MYKKIQFGKVNKIIYVIQVLIIGIFIHRIKIRCYKIHRHPALLSEKIIS